MQKSIRSSYFLSIAALMTALQPATAFASPSTGSPTPHANPACRTGQTYVAAGNIQDSDGIAAIFADRVDYIGPDGVRRENHADIAAVYKRFSGKINIVRRVAHMAPIDGRSCLVEMESSEDGGPFLPSAVAHFEVDASGKVVRFLPFILTARALWLAQVQQKSTPE